MRFIVVFALLCVAACAQRPAPAARPDYSMNLTGYDVPRPAAVPFTDPLEVREYLSFYHAAYLEYANDPKVGWHSSITPRSPRPDAAVLGHNDGQRDARQAKQTFWRRRGVEPWP